MTFLVFLPHLTILPRAEILKALTQVQPVYFEKSSVNKSLIDR